MENSATSTTELEVPAQQPAPGAEDQKPTPPASDADAQNPEVVETPEQVEAKKESRRARSNARKAQALADARAEAKLLREERDRLNAKLEERSKPQESGEPKRENYDSDDAFLKAFIRHEAKQELEQGRKAEREAEQGKEKQQKAAAGSEKVAKEWSEREKSFQTATKDYDAVVGPFAEEEMQQLSYDARMAIVESDVGPALLYHLAKHPEEAERIADLSPLRQIAELGKLEAKVSMPAKKTTSAPAPASTTSGGRTASKDPSKMDQKEYEDYRKSQGARWAR